MTTFILSATVIAVASALSINSIVEAQTVRRTSNKAGGIACFSETKFSEFTKAAIHAKDNRDPTWMQSLLNSQQCFAMKRGLQFTIKDFGYLGVSEIYLHPPGGGAPVTVWTANENL